MTKLRIELNFIYNHGPVTGAIHVDGFDSHNGGNANTGDGLELEQAHITYSLDNGVSFQLGKYGSGLGFEREDPTSLYTFSRAYEAGSGFNLGNIDNENQHAFEGLAVGYASDAFSIRASFQNSAPAVGDPPVQQSNGDIDGEENELDLELSFSYTGIDNLTIGGGALFDNQGDAADEIDVINFHVATNLGKFFLAGEYTELDRGGNNSDLDGWLVLVDYDFNDKLGVAFRVSSNEIDDADEYEKVTIAPNYNITDSLGAILEYSDVENAGQDGNELALEFLYTF